MTQPSKTLYFFNTLHCVDVIVCIVQLLNPSYAPFLRRIFFSNTPNACSSKDVIVQLSAQYNKTGDMSDLYYISKYSFSKRGLCYSITFLVTWSAQRFQGRTFLRLPPPGSDAKTLRTELELSIRATWTCHWRRCIFSTSMLSYNRTAPASNRMWHSPLSQKGSEILRRLFLSNRPNGCSSEDVIVQVSATYNKTGNLSDLYKQIFVLQERALLLNCFLSPKLHLLARVILRLISRLMSLLVFLQKPRYTKSFTTSIQN